jgi:cytochrome oxidase assembly protein ShyY1
VTNGQPHGVVERAPSNAVVRASGGALARPATAATYDTLTADLSGWQFVVTRRWLRYIGFAVAFAIACGFLSHWQLDRGNQAVASNALISANFDSTPAPLATVLPTLTSYNASQVWKRVEVTGTYIARDQLFVRNRPLGSNDGFEVLTPLRLSNGKQFIVDRGWVGAGSDSNYPASEPTPPSGTVTVVARLRAGEPVFGGITPIKNQIQTIQLGQVKQKIGGEVYTGAYGLLDYQTPAASSALKPVVTSKPTVDEGLHWSYMIQWIIFALIGFFGLGYAIRTEFRRINEDDPAEQARETARIRKRALKAFTDAEVEDEALDGFVPLSRWAPASDARSREIVRPEQLPLPPGHAKQIEHE